MFTMSNRFVVFPAFFFFLFYFSLFLFCIYYQFIPVEDLCVDLLLLWISLSFSGGFLAEDFFFPFVFIFALGASMSEGVFESFGRSGYSLYNLQERRFYPKRQFLPSTKDRASESRVMHDPYP